MQTIIDRGGYLPHFRYNNMEDGFLPSVRFLFIEQFQFGLLECF